MPKVAWRQWQAIEARGGAVCINHPNVGDFDRHFLRYRQAPGVKEGECSVLLSVAQGLLRGSQDFCPLPHTKWPKMCTHKVEKNVGKARG